MRDRERLLSLGGLALLALVAAILSLAALFHTRPTSVDAVPAPTVAATVGATPTPASPSASSAEPTASAGTGSPSGSASPTEETSATGDMTVVVIGDRHSRAELGDVWVDRAAEELGWGEVVNLSDPGRGYSARPGECSVDVCANFAGTIAAIADAEPDVVVTFGGTADGDYDISTQTADYYSSLREALPEVEIVAVSPVTSTDDAPFWLTMHARNIRSAAESVDGRFIDVGQPGVGDGDELSAEAQDEVASAIIDALS